MDIICDYDKCTGCSLCSDVCNSEAIIMKENHDGFIVPFIDNTKCIDCGLCIKNCPVVNPNRITNNDLSDVIIYEGWATNKEIRKKSSSGGVFGQLAFDNLSNNGIVLGVTFDGMKAYHKAINKLEDLIELQNTKYVQSYASGAYIATLKYLREGKSTVFSGTPCQVAACKSFLFKKHFSGKLLTIEVICHGVPSYLTLKESLKYNNAVRVKSFRNKDNGWGYHSQCMEYYTSGNKIIRSNRNKDLFYRLFFSENFLRPSCYTCTFANMPRVADITIGDSWGTQNSNQDEIFDGLSLIIINNKNGQHWIEEDRNVVLKGTNWIESLFINRNIYTPFPPKNIMAENIDSIEKFFKQINDYNYMQIHALGFNEVKLKYSNKLKSVLYKIRNQLYKHLIKVPLYRMNKFKFNLLIITFKLESILTDRRSMKFLDLKFIKLLRNLYISKK